MLRIESIGRAVERLDDLVGQMLARLRGAAQAAAGRWRGETAALQFHLSRRPDQRPILLAVLGGTGTGKSTLLNRLLEKEISATSFRRTFTSGAVAVASNPELTPREWLRVPHVVASAGDLPVRGSAGSLLVVPMESELLKDLILIDTPDLDGDQPAHHAQADRVFRWAQAVLFLVTPEKYQMNELLPYYRLASRYGLPARFVMNKCEQQAAADDYQQMLIRQGAGIEQTHVFVVARDDAGYEPAPSQNLAALREDLGHISLPDSQARSDALARRTADLLGRLTDQVLAPARQDRSEVNRLIAQLHQMETPVPGIDVNPMTQQLQRRMQQRSVLYLMGPQRVLERIRQAPGLLVRLPRVAWDYVMRGEISAAAFSPAALSEEQNVPDFAAILTDQFAILQSRLDDLLRESNLGHDACPDPKSPPWKPAMIDPAEAGQIAQSELAELKTWLERRWNATPRDTRLLETLLKHLPGGKQITRWTEAAPYLLVITLAAATHHLLGGIDLIVLGGWGLATWISEKLSNEVAAQTRRTNQKMVDRFSRLAHEQIERLCGWLDEQAPADESLQRLEEALDEARERLEQS